MATLTGQLVSETYKSLLKMIDNDVVTASEKQISDGFGGGTNVFLDQNGFVRANKYKVTGANSGQFLKGDGSLDSTSYLPVGTSTTSIPEGTNQYFTQLRVLNSYLAGFTPTSGVVSSSDSVLTALQKIWWNIVNGGGGGGGGYVPYVGATQNLNLGEWGLNTGFIQFDLTPTGTPTTAGTMSWNDSAGTADIKLKRGNVTLQVGQESVVPVINKTGANLLESQYKVVRERLVSEGGAQGQRLAVVLAQANNDTNSVTTLGLVTENINNNQEGFVTTFGEVNDINTTGSLQGETWVDGDTLYLSGTIAGGLTNIKPQAPIHLVTIGTVVYAHAIHGKIFVKVQNGYELEELHDVKIDIPSQNNFLVYQEEDALWQNKALIKTNGYLSYFDDIDLLLDSPIFTNGTKIAIGTETFYGTNLATIQGGVWAEELTINENLLISSATLSGNAFISRNSGTSWVTMLGFYANNITAEKEVIAPKLTINGSIYGESVSVFDVAKITADTATNNYVLHRWNGVSWDAQLTFLASQILSIVDIKAPKFIKTGGLATEFLMANGDSATIASLNIITGGGTANYIPKWSGTKTIGDSLLYDTGTNIGINTTNPAYKFTVVGSMGVWSSSTNYGFQDTANTSYRLVSANGFQFTANNIGTVATTRVDSAGNWGFGIGTPAYKVDVSGDVNITTGSSYRINGTALTTTNIPEGTPKYFTENRVLSTVLDGLNTSLTDPVTQYDSLIVGISKLQHQISAIVSGVSSVSGTANRISVNQTTGAVTVNIASTYVGQTSITTLGTISSGTWNGTAITDTYISSASSWNTAYSDRLKWDGGSTGLVASTGRTSLGATTVGSNLFTLTNPSAVTFLRVNADNTVSALNASDFRTAIGAGTSSTTGTVTSVGLSSTTTGITIGSTPITTSGTITINIATASGTLQGLLSSTDWNTFNNKQNALGYTPVPTTRTLTINGTPYDLSADRSWTIAGTISGLTTNYIPKATSATTIGNSLIYDNGTNVGIGTASPSVRLDVRGGATNTEGGDIYSSNRSFAWSQYINGTSGFYSLYNGGDRFIINTSGNVSIGNTNNTYKLDVTGVTRSNAMIIKSDASSVTYLDFDATARTSGRNYELGTGYTAVGNDKFYLFDNTANATRILVDANGNVGIGTQTALTGYSLWVNKNIGEQTTSNGIVQSGQVQSAVTASANGILNTVTTQASAFTLTNYRHFYANQGTLGAGSAITNQYGFFVESNLTSATNNYAFFSNLASGANRWNLYMSGTANNYLAGNLSVGTTTTTYKINIQSGSNFGFFDLYSGGAALGSTGGLEFYTGATPTRRIRILDTGEVGINTTAPLTALTVSGNLSLFTTNQIRLYNSAKNNWTQIDSPLISGDTEVDLKITAKTGYVYVSANGSLGINTTNVQASLDVATTGGFTYNTTSSAGVRIGTQGTTGGSLMVQTASLSSGYGSGFAVDGTYSGGKSTIQLTAFGVYSGGPYSADMVFRTSVNTTISERMRINSGGNVSIGNTNNTYKLDVSGTGIFRSNELTLTGSAYPVIAAVATSTFPIFALLNNAQSAQWNIELGRTTANALEFYYSGTKMTLNSSGNLGLGVTPSAWSVSGKVLELAGNSGNGSLFNNGVNDFWISSNVYFNGTNWIYKNDGYSTQYHQANGKHEWYIAGSGLANNTITYTQAMTLDASGKLLVGTTTSDANSIANFAGAIRSSADFRSIVNGSDSAYQGGFYQQTASGTTYASAFQMDASGNQRLYTYNTTSGFVNRLIILNSNGNVGIGTTSPSVVTNYINLHIQGTNGGSLTLTNSSGVGGSIQGNSGGTSYVVGASLDHIFYLNGTPNVIFKSSGNVGIGITSPSGKLHLYSTSTTYLDVESNGASGIIRLKGGSYNGILSEVSGVNQWYITGGGASKVLTFGTDNTERMRITSGGNVGIGTTSPSQKLEVVGNISATTTITSGSGVNQTYLNAGNLDFYNAASSNKFIRVADDSSTINAIGFSKSGSTATTWFPSGNVGIGTTSPSYKLDVAGDIALGLTSTANKLRIARPSDGDKTSAYLGFESTSSNTSLILANNSSSGNLVFKANSVEGFRLSNDINNPATLLINTTSSFASFVRLQINSDGYSPGLGVKSSDYLVGFFNTSNSYVGTIYTNGTSTIYSTSSDYRLKTDLRQFNGLSLLDRINVYDYAWKSNNTRDYGVMAHELQEVLPNAVSGIKDGNKMQGVDYSKVVPILVQSIKELKAELDLLKNK